jgi:hypothetical protein
MFLAGSITRLKNCLQVPKQECKQVPKQQCTPVYVCEVCEQPTYAGRR